MVATKYSGFSLIENVIAICLMGLLMISFSSLLAPQAVQTADTLTQQRYSQIATLLLQEMYSRPFDEQNIDNVDRCDAGSCSATETFGQGQDAGEQVNETGILIRDDFDDYATNSAFEPITSFGLGFAGPYQDFEVRIDVEYVDDSWASVASGATATKHAIITLRKGATTETQFNAYRSNY